MKSIAQWFNGRGFILFVIIIHLAGILLFIIPAARHFLCLLIPSILLIYLALIFISHRDWSWRSLAVFLSIYILAMLLELAGVSDQRLFGAYQYHDTLGFKVGGVPLLIGVNWLMLTYCSHSISRELFRNILPRILSGALIMVAYDIMLEFVTPHLNMWSFDKPYPPLQNFLAWFIAAVAFQSLLEIFRVNTENKPARILMIAQILFFLTLGLFSALVL